MGSCVLFLSQILTGTYLVTTMFKEGFGGLNATIYPTGINATWARRSIFINWLKQEVFLEILQKSSILLLTQKTRALGMHPTRPTPPQLWAGTLRPEQQEAILQGTQLLALGEHQSWACLPSSATLRTCFFLQ
ncbi:hypothetical protein MUG91_G61n41 [Manis pentadactyla]|nr:hypothetical protein MUG91_G61n41 [Manis pentadactyla]